MTRRARRGARPHALVHRQAPAGSGKTDPDQRYRLLATSRIGSVAANTFTRKAAAEMRRRVQQALRTAAAGEPAASEHGAATPRSRAR